MKNTWGTLFIRTLYSGVVSIRHNDGSYFALMRAPKWNRCDWKMIASALTKGGSRRSEAPGNANTSKMQFFSFSQPSITTQNEMTSVESIRSSTHEIDIAARQRHLEIMDTLFELKRKILDHDGKLEVLQSLFESLKCQFNSQQDQSIVCEKLDQILHCLAAQKPNHEMYNRLQEDIQSMSRQQLRIVNHLKKISSRLSSKSDEDGYYSWEHEHNAMAAIEVADDLFIETFPAGPLKSPGIQCKTSQIASILNIKLQRNLFDAAEFDVSSQMSLEIGL